MRRFLGALLISATLVPFALAEKRGPSTPDERQRALNVIHKLEEQPMSPQMAKDREWVFQWLQDVPDLRVFICTGVIGPLLNEKKSDARNAITLQHLLASAAFQMEHPEQANDLTAVYTAGSEGMLRAYERVLKDNPQYRSTFLEELRAKQSNGTLTAYVRRGLDRCKQNAKYRKPPSAMNN